MDRRRRSTILGIFTFIFYLCIIGSTKSSFAFDISNSTAGTEYSVDRDEENGMQYSLKIRRLVTPPQPKKRSGKFICTRDRYIKHEEQVGKASWYGGEFDGARTASGERFNMNAFTLAHLTLPMGTKVLVENPITGVSFHARVNDCGPFIKGRIADLSYGLAKSLGIMKAGTGTVIITVL